MKSLEEAIKQELSRAQCSEKEMEELNLDSLCRTAKITGLDNFSGLKTLSLCNVGLTSLEGFPPLQNLEKLILADNKISGGLEALTDLVSLRTINLAHNKIASLEALKPLAGLKLERLDLFECPVEAGKEDFRQNVFSLIESLKVLDNVDRDGKEHLDSDEEDEFSFDESDSSDDGDEEDEGDDDDDDEEVEEEEEVEGAGVSGEHPPASDSASADEEGEEGAAGDEDSDGNELGLEVLAGPPIRDSEDDINFEFNGEDPGSEDIEDDADQDDDDDDDDEQEIAPPRATPSSGVKKRKRGPDAGGEDYDI